MPIYSSNKKAKLYIGAQKVKSAYIGATKVYSSGNIVTYHVDSGTTYQEEVEEGASCLSPKTFTPAKSGWTFVGWSGSATSHNILSSAIMGDSPVHLYAVFQQTITVTYYNGSTTASTTSGYRKYNNGTVVNPSFALTQAALSGWTARGWSTSTAGNGGITYANGASFTRDSNVTLYGCYYQTITLSYNGNGNTAGSTATQTGTRYWNTGNTINPTFTLNANGFSRTSYSFYCWASGSASGTQYNAGASVTLSVSTVFYAVWVVTEKTFSYTGSMQSYTIPETGLYLLRVYGAQGGNSSGGTDYGSIVGTGGKGGYAYGYKVLTKGTVVYVGVGGAGITGTALNLSGGYNGGGGTRGGAASQGFGGSGGGCTHMGTFNSVLKSGSTSGLFIVAGGGGGGAVARSTADAAGGTGGGTNGGNAGNGVYGFLGTGATQSGTGANGSYYGVDGGFGYGGSATAYYAAGGGGGLYGGRSGGQSNGGGGGSGYIGGVSTITYNGKTYSPSMSNGIQGGNGTASITFIAK